ncbi:MAG: M12 family metallo-peptidase [Pirellulales bacterium]
MLNQASAAVVIVANRTETTLRFEAQRQQDSSWRRQVIDPGDCVAISLESSETLSIRGADAGSYRLAPYGMYYFGATQSGNIELREIGLAMPEVVARPQEHALLGAQADLGVHMPAKDNKDKDNEARRSITIAIYVDDEEPTVDQVWRKRLADRVAQASRILERSCGMKLTVKSFGRWETNDAVDDFELSLREFERQVRPKDVQVAIGFTNQYQITRGRTHLGGTHGPLHSHILLREWSQHVTEPERLELLVHELAHFLGAAHSPENGSVMRPLLGDRQARARAFRIALDPVNALAMSVVGEEIRDRGITSFAQLSEPSRARLEAVYTTLAQSMPNDPAPAAYLRYVKRQRPAP